MFIEENYYSLRNDRNPPATLLVEVEEVILQVKAQWEEGAEVEISILEKDYSPLADTPSLSTISIGKLKTSLTEEQWEEIDLDELELVEVSQEEKIEPVQPPGYFAVFKGIIHSIKGDDSD